MELQTLMPDAFLRYSGFKGKTLWDWLELLIIPIVLAIGGFTFDQLQKNREETRAEQRTTSEQFIATDNQREEVLQAYFDDMSDLLLVNKLRISTPGAEVRNVARIRTLSTLNRLDAERNNTVLQFLRESQLINTTMPIVSLSESDLTEVDLSFANLRGLDLSTTTLMFATLTRANLEGANLERADLRAAEIENVNLQAAHLPRANLAGASLYQANLNEADLRGALINGASLKEAKLNRAILQDADLRGTDLQGTEFREATYNRNTKWPDGFDPQAAGAILAP